MDKIGLMQRVESVQARIEQARERSGRTEAVSIVAVTKTHPADAIEQARLAGLSDVGENRVGELEEKVAVLGRDVVRWHLIGHLQRNKVSRVLPLFDLFHALDSHRLARALSKAAQSAETTARVLLQVNTSGEESKGGFEPDEFVDVAGEICELPGLRVEGAMTMAPFTDDERVLRGTFKSARRLFETAADQVTGFRPLHLSMGMSNDFEIAVEEGSTLVRLGSVLFGEREP